MYNNKNNIILFPTEVQTSFSFCSRHEIKSEKNNFSTIVQSNFSKC